MVVKFDLIAAACDNMGIGKKNDLPWRLKTEMAFFTRMTSDTVDKTKKNVVIMGRRTWDSIPPKFKPLQNRINFILTRSDINIDQYKDVYKFASLDKAVAKLEDADFQRLYENVWVIGGSTVYKETMNSPHFHRLYLTKIMQHFDCDTFFPKFREDLVETSDARVPQGIQTEKGIEFVYKIYETKK